MVFGIRDGLLCRYLRMYLPPSPADRDYGRAVQELTWDFAFRTRDAMRGFVMLANVALLSMRLPAGMGTGLLQHCRYSS